MLNLGSRSDYKLLHQMLNNILETVSSGPYLTNKVTAKACHQLSRV